MVTPISEDDARAALLNEKSEASNSDYFEAGRRENGWVFGWRKDSGAVPMGTHTWIVADNARVRMLNYKDLWDDALGEELAK